MNKRGHWFLGVVSGFGFILITGLMDLSLYVFNLWNIVIMLIIIGFYSILPDIDHKAGTMTWTFLAIGIFGALIGVLLLIFHIGNPLALLSSSVLLLVLTFVSAHWIPHRGIIHSIPVGIFSIIPLWFLFHSFAYCLLGYIAWHSHLVGDKMPFKMR